MRQKSYDNTPTLYIVPTPIGNMEDMTFRALNVLKEVNVIFAEDTRVTKQLLQYYEIKKPLISSHLYNEEKNCDKELEYLNNHQNIAIVSDRGTPVISDPGYILIKKAIENNYNVVCLPGANALIPAYVMSGLSSGPFTFYGFLNNKESKRKKELIELENSQFPIIFYEAPHRIKDTLENIQEIFGNRKAVIAREITKKYEEIIRGNIDELIKETENIKGEIVLIIDGNHQKKDFSDLSIIDHINIYLKEGKTSKEAIKLVAKDRNLPKNEVYKEYHKK